MLTRREVIGSMAAAPLLKALPGEPFPLRRGTNISHWLSQSKRRGAERREMLRRRDVAWLAGLGLDHLRLPVDEEQLFTVDGKPETEAFDLLNEALDWCDEFSLRAIVDLHILRSHHFNEKVKPLWTEPAAQERFFECWRGISAQIGKRSTLKVAYELMNEPVADDPEQWNKLVDRAATAIRAKEPKRTIVIGSNRWQSVDTFDKLRVPEQDPNILLSFHFYEPFLLTHHGASWTAIGAYRGPVGYPGKTVKDEDLSGVEEKLAKQIRGQSREWNREKIAEKMNKAVEVAKRYQLPLYCGEWGCLKGVPRDARLQWYRDMISVLSQEGIGWATWDYKGGFGLREDRGEVDDGVLGILLPKQ
jgi:endoglucanase